MLGFEVLNSIGFANGLAAQEAIAAESFQGHQRTVSRGDADAEEPRPTDLAAVLRTLCDDAADRGHPGTQQPAVVLQPLVTQRIALVHVNDGRRQTLHVVVAGERRPGERVLRVERLDTVRHCAAIVVQLEQDAVVLGG